MGKGEAVFLYVMQMECGTIRPIKVGISALPERRLLNIQTASPFPIKLMLTVDCESRETAKEIEGYIHAFFHEFRLNGEWFDVPVEDVCRKIAVLTAMMAAITVFYVLDKELHTDEVLEAARSRQRFYCSELETKCRESEQ